MKDWETKKYETESFSHRIDLRPVEANFFAKSSKVSQKL
jgi:hypothetical protein